MPYVSTDQNKKNVTSSRRVVKNALFNSAGWTVNVLLALVATPILVKKLSMEGYGIYSLLTGLASYYSLLDLGLGQGVIKFISEAKAKNDAAQINHSINTALCLQIILGIIGSLLLVLLAVPLLRLLKVSPQFFHDAQTGLYVCTFGFFFTMISSTLSSSLMGLQRYDITSKVTASANVLITAAITALALLGYGLLPIVYVTVVFNFITAITLFLIVKNHLPEWRLSLSIDRAFFRKMFNFSGYLFVFKLSSLFNNYLVRFIISAILGPAMLTYYVVPMKIITALGGFLNNIATVLFPFASELKAVEQKEKLQNVYIKAEKYITTLAFPVYLLLCFFSKEILTIWMGNDFATQGWVVMSILAGAYFLSALTMVPANITFGLGYTKVIAVFSGIVLILDLVFIPPLAYYFNIIGAALGLLIATIQAPIFIWYVTKKVIKSTIYDFLKKTITYNIGGAFVSVLVFYFFKSYSAGIPIWFLFVLSIVYGAIYYSAAIFFKWISLQEINKLIANKH